ncbi:MAG: hypothetical protein ABI728_15310 [Betaproteobacteria bacterium]
MNELFIGLIAVVLGMEYFVYGKRKAKFARMISGVVLCVVPYLVSSLGWLCVIGAIPFVVPFVTDY